jgi:hypothetical protein
MSEENEPDGMAYGFNWISILALIAFIVLIISVIVGAMNG